MDAIELTTLFDLTGLSREEMMFDKEKLLSVFDQTVAGGDGPDPHPSRPAERGVGAGPRAARGDDGYTDSVERIVRDAMPHDVSLAALPCRSSSACSPSTGCCRAYGRIHRSGAPWPALALLSGGWLLDRRRARSRWKACCSTPSPASPSCRAALLVTQRNPARAALSFALVVLSTCGLFLLLAAPFLMAATTIVYAGAIVVTFLFVIMLAQQEGRSDADQRSREPLLAAIAGFVLLGALLYLLQTNYAATPELDQLAALTRRAADVKGRLDGLEDSVETPQGRAEALQAVEEASALLDEYDAWTTEISMGAQAPRHRTHHSTEDVERLRDLAVNTRPLTNLARRRLREEKGRVDLEELGAGLQTVHAAAARFDNTQSFLEPRERDRLSEFSGPAPNRWGPTLRRDAQGRPQMPGENVAFLGRSLFTDYLIRRGAGRDAAPGGHHRRHRHCLPAGRGGARMSRAAAPLSWWSVPCCSRSARSAFWPAAT